VCEREEGFGAIEHEGFEVIEREEGFEAIEREEPWSFDHPKAIHLPALDYEEHL
jgi:hypothetical protein